MKQSIALFSFLLIAFSVLGPFVQVPINQTTYNQATPVPMAYRVIVGILLIVILVVLIWKALKYLIGAIFIIIILLIIASTAYYFFKTGSVSIAYSLSFLVDAANGLAKYLPIPSIYNSTIGKINLTTTISTQEPYINSTQAMALMGVSALSSASFYTYPNSTAIKARFGSFFASNSTYAWLAIYASGKRNLTEAVFLSNMSSSMYDYLSRNASAYAVSYNGLVNGMHYSYAQNSSLNETELLGWEGNYLAIATATGMHINATDLAKAVAQKLS